MYRQARPFCQKFYRFPFNLVLLFRFESKREGKRKGVDIKEKGRMGRKGEGGRKPIDTRVKLKVKRCREERGE